MRYVVSHGTQAAPFPLTPTTMQAQIPSIIEDLANPSLDEGTGCMLRDVGLAFFEELDKSFDVSAHTSTVDILAGAAYDMLDLAESASFFRPFDDDRVTTRDVRTLGLSASAAHPPTCAQLVGVNDPKPKQYAKPRMCDQQPQ